MPNDQPRGPDGRWIKGKAAGGAVGAALVAGLMAAAGGGDATTSVGAALDAAVNQSAADSETASNQRAAKNGDEAAKAWQRMALKEIKRDVKHELRCAVQSYGQVQQFFLRNPCDKLNQLLFAVSDPQGDIIVGSVMWVKLSSSAVATQFQQLEDTYGTGDVTPFGTEVLELGGFKFTGKHYMSRSDGSLVVIAETEPGRGRPSDALLKEVATVADVLPPL